MNLLCSNAPPLDTARNPPTGSAPPRTRLNPARTSIASRNKTGTVTTVASIGRPMPRTRPLPAGPPPPRAPPAPPSRLTAAEVPYRPPSRLTAAEVP